MELELPFPSRAMERQKAHERLIYPLPVLNDYPGESRQLTNFVARDAWQAIDFVGFRLALDLPEAGNQMLRIRRTANGDVVLGLSGRIDKEDVAELEALIAAEGKDRRIILDLKDMTLTGQEGIAFLARREADGVVLANCDPYVREWITRQGAGN